MIWTFSRSAASRAWGCGRTPKPMMMALVAMASVTSVSEMAPTAEWMLLMRTSDWSILPMESARASMVPWASALTTRLSSLSSFWLISSNRVSSVLDDQVELLELVLAHLVEQGLERDVLDLVLLLDAGLEGALLGEVAGVTGVLEDAELVTGGRDGVEAQDLDGVGGTGLVLVVAVLVEHGADGAVALTGHDGVAHV